MIIPRMQATGMKKKDRYNFVLEYFSKEMPRVTTELEFGSVYQLLVAVILSALTNA